VRILYGWVTDPSQNLQPGRHGDLVFGVTFEAGTGFNALEYRRSKFISVFENIIIIIANLCHQVF
jgi:hypothetical protein